MPEVSKNKIKPKIPTSHVIFTDNNLVISSLELGSNVMFSPFLLNVEQFLKMTIRHEKNEKMNFKEK